MLKRKTKVTLNSRNFDYYEKLGYQLPKPCPRGFSIEVDINHLTSSSKTKVERTCDSCGRLDLVTYRDLGSHEFCKKCSTSRQTGKKNPFYGKKHSPESRRKMRKSQSKIDRSSIIQKAKDKYAQMSGYETREQMVGAVIKFLEKEGCGASSRLLNKIGVTKTQAILIVKQENRLDLLNENESFRVKRLSKANEDQKEREATKRGFESYSQMESQIIDFLESNKIGPNTPLAKERFPLLSATTLMKVLIRANRDDLISEFTSSGEIEVAQFIDSLGIQYSKGDREALEGKEIDLYIPSLKLGIEYNGLYWHSDKFREDKAYHLKKRELAESKGIKLIQVNSDEWILKKDIVKSIIKNQLGLLTDKIDARKCEVRKVGREESYDFQEENHLMGGVRIGTTYGIYYKGKLVSLMVVRKLRDGIDITRFCNLKDTLVRGAFSKILSKVRSDLNPKFIQSFIDERYATGSSLKGLGFEKVKTTLGWKWTDGKKTWNRLACRANMDARGLSQEEYAKEKNWFKIYDAGQTKWILS
jgi:hypothetical protein